MGIKIHYGDKEQFHDFSPIPAPEKESSNSGGGGALWSWDFSFSGWTIDETNPNKLIADTAGQAKIDELRNFIAENYQNVKDIRFVMSIAMGDGHNEYNVAFNYLRGDNMGVGANFQAITVTSPSSRLYDCFLLWLDTYSLQISADNFAPVIKGYASGSIKIY